MSYKELSWISESARPGYDQPYAEVWKRFIALSIDNYIITCLATILTPLLELVLLSQNASREEQDIFFMIVPYLPGAVNSPNIFLMAWFGLALIYHTIMPALPIQATIGKWLMNIYLGTPLGNRVSPAVTFTRFYGYAFSSVPFGIGFLIALFNQQHIAFHDFICKTRVFKGKPGNLAQEIQGDHIDMMTKAARSGQARKELAADAPRKPNSW